MDTLQNDGQNPGQAAAACQADIDAQPAEISSRRRSRAIRCQKLASYSASMAQEYASMSYGSGKRLAIHAQVEAGYYAATARMMMGIR